MRKMTEPEYDNLDRTRSTRENGYEIATMCMPQPNGLSCFSDQAESLIERYSKGESFHESFKLCASCGSPVVCFVRLVLMLGDLCEAETGRAGIPLD